MTFQVPKDRPDQVAGLLMLVGDRLARLADRRLASWKMGESDYNVLRVLNGSDKPLTQIEIGRRLLCSRANVTKIVDRLEEKKMVRRRPSGDRRENHIEITAQGVKFLRETILEVIQLSHESLSPLTHRQLLDLEKLLLMLVRSIPDLDLAVRGSEQPRRSGILALPDKPKNGQSIR